MASSPPKAKLKPKTSPPPPPTEHLPPHSEEAEQALLGAILLNPDCLPLVDFLTPEDFWIVKNGWIFQAARDLDERDEQLDYVTLVDKLRDQGHLEELGGPAYITHLMNHTPSSLYAETYGRIIERAAIRRRMLNSASRIAVLAHSEDQDIHEVEGLARISLDEAFDRQSERPIQVISRAVSAYFDTIIDGDSAPTFKTGLADLDEMLGGLQPDDLMLVAGRPGMGKTSWLLSVILNAARRIKAGSLGQYVYHASLEMSAAQVVQRLYSMTAGIPVKTQRTRTLTDEQLSAFMNVTEELSDLPILIDDRPGMTVRQLKAACRRAQRLYGPLAVIVVDYAQLMTVEPEIIRELKLNSSENLNAYISRQLKELARTTKVPVLVACQLNREVEKRRNKRPQSADLRGSGTWEQDADIICLLYRDEVYNENTLTPNEAENIITKYRHGATGTVSTYFDRERTLFGNLTKTTIPLSELAWQSWPGQSNNASESEVLSLDE